MKINFRKAIATDATGMVNIKDQLPLTMSDGATTNGGFLLGSDENTYQQFIENDYCLVAENENGLIGFGIILRNNSLKQSDIWTRRHDANWQIEIDTYENKSVCYFEQLAFVPGYHRAVLKLAYNLVCRAFEDGHSHLFTTTVRKPVLNLAAVPYITKGGGTLVGQIHEVYPIVGDIESDIYKLDAEDMHRVVEKSVLYPFLKRNYIAGK